MKKIVLITMLAFALPVHAFAQAGRAAGHTLKVVITLLTGAAASKAAAETTMYYHVFNDKSEILQSLRAQGMTIDQPAIYSLYFSLNFDASAVYWADFIGRPDVFTLIQMQGVKDCIVPAITYEYSGQPLLSTIVHSEILAGSRVLIHFLDDDTASNDIWNNILKTKTDFSISAQGKTVLSSMLIDSKVAASGQIQLLNENVTLDAPDYIATAEFVVPETKDGIWVANGIVYDNKNLEVGTVQLAQIWRPLNSPAGIRRIKKEINEARSKMIFWGGVGVVCVAVFAKLLFDQRK
jgi:hypothetical protein